jgi:hypothetical protein
MDPTLGVAPEILAFGEPLVELVEICRPGEPRTYLQGFGGDTSNFCVAAARSGGHVATSAPWVTTASGGCCASSGSARASTTGTC